MTPPPDMSAKAMAQLRTQAEAAVWIARLHNPRHGSATERDLRQWIDASEDHAEAWKLATVIWKETGALAMSADAQATLEEGRQDQRPDPHRFHAIGALEGLSALVLVVCSGIMAFLSARGTYALFDRSWPAAVAFAGVVQFVVWVSLWGFPRKPAGTQLLLAGACAAAMLLSIGSAYYDTYRTHAGDAVARARDLLTQVLITSEIRRANAAAELRSDRSRPASSSAAWYSIEPASAGHSERVLRARSVVSDTLTELARPDLTMEDLRRIYIRLVRQSLVPPDSLQDSELSSNGDTFVAEILRGYRVCFGVGGAVSTQERSRVLNSLFAASVMEMLALMVAVVRCAMLEAYMRRVARDGATRWARATQQVQESSADPDAEKVERAWETVLTSEIQRSGSEWRRLVVELLPDYDSLCRPTGKGLYCSSALFDPRVFSHRPAVLHGALATGAILRTSEGELIPGARWEQWIRFLLAKLPNTSAVGRRMPRQKHVARRKRVARIRGPGVA